MSDLKDAALDYAARGFRPIPCEPRGKRPLVEWKRYQHEQASPEEISAWWDQWPEANVALVLGRGIFAVDVDSTEGHAALKGAGIVFPSQTPTSLTGRGVHYFFHGTQPDRVAVLSGVDIRGVGIVVVPPSVHATGKRYTWLQGLETIGEAPFALLSLLQQPTKGVAAPDSGSWLTEALAGVGEGRRDATCTRLAGYFLSKGMPKDVVIQDLLGWAKRCTPPFPDAQVIKCVDSIAQKHTPFQGLDVMTVDRLYLEAPEEHEWILQDYIPRGSLVMLASEEKVGKSTFVYALAAAIAQGKDFLDRAVRQSRVLILAVEEHKTDVKIRSRKFGLREGDEVRYFIGALGGDAETNTKLKQYVIEQDIQLVILDTMGHYLSGFMETENDNFQMLKGLKPWLHLARETNAAVLIVHHTGKGGVQAYRGASSAGGIVDQVLTLRHAGGSVRMLDAKGRYWQTPEKIWVDLQGDEYKVLHANTRE